MRDISNYSNVSLAQKKATNYIGKKIYLSTRKDKNIYGSKSNW
jgi:hypothetical protein